ncbi:hypothetical protein BpHYR1_053085 [Brachionus plicatilis]|uniref:Uncharacterized protein n=1 Tax=Brachionus plicatilis TaxID=10195 RepID=A0A3M7PUN2_BRAPC|nr:hypothetical protein BpHYR1_053085 [Brachionus plicatilis]
MPLITIFVLNFLTCNFFFVLLVIRNTNLENILNIIYQQLICQLVGCGQRKFLGNRTAKKYIKILIF